jgi:hypothetical protein
MYAGLIFADSLRGHVLDEGARRSIYATQLRNMRMRTQTHILTLQQRQVRDAISTLLLRSESNFSIKPKRASMGIDSHIRLAHASRSHPSAGKGRADDVQPVASDGQRCAATDGYKDRAPASASASASAVFHNAMMCFAVARLRRVRSDSSCASRSRRSRSI